MQRSIRIFLFAVIAGLPAVAPAFAQSSPEHANSGNVAQQFNAGANRVGQGAAQIGNGIKDGAIMTWQAFRDGANAFAGRFRGERDGAAGEDNSSAQ